MLIWTSLISLFLFPGVFAHAGRSRPSDTAPFVLEQQYDRETNPRGRAEIAIKLATVRLQELRASYRARATIQPQSAAENYLSALERLITAVREASHAGTSKSSEQALRRQLQALENLKMNVSYVYRPALDEVIQRVTAYREEILYSLMAPPQEAA